MERLQDRPWEYNRSECPKKMSHDSIPARNMRDLRSAPTEVGVVTGDGVERFQDFACEETFGVFS